MNLIDLSDVVIVLLMGLATAFYILHRLNQPLPQSNRKIVETDITEDGDCYLILGYTDGGFVYILGKLAKTDHTPDGAAQVARNYIGQTISQ